MGLGTKDVKDIGGGLPKIISPGEHTLKINSLELKQFPFMEADAGYYLVLHVETKPIENFEGFFFDKDDESKGRHEGQIGQVKTSKWYYKDGETKSGIKVERDLDILRQIKNICIATDNMKWFEAADGKYDTIEEFVEAFNEKKPFADKFLKVCVAGKEFERTNGYVGHDLYLPKLKKGNVAFEAEKAKISKLIAYNEAEMLVKLESKPAEKFEDASEAADEIPVDADPLEGAPEFDL